MLSVIIIRCGLAGPVTKGVPGTNLSSMHATSGIFGQKGHVCRPRAQKLVILDLRKGKKQQRKSTTRTESVQKNCPSSVVSLIQSQKLYIAKTANFFSWPIYELRSLESWTNGHVILIGDAAHALPPKYPGQGLSQAIEDVFVLNSLVLECDKPLVRYGPDGVVI